MLSKVKLIVALRIGIGIIVAILTGIIFMIFPEDEKQFLPVSIITLVTVYTAVVMMYQKSGYGIKLL